MKRFQFAEQPLLALRDQQRRIAELSVMQAQQAVKEAEAAVEQAEKRLNDATVWVLDPHRDGLLYIHQSMGTLVDLLVIRKEVRERAYELLTKAQHQLQTLNRNVEMLQSLRSLRQRDYRHTCNQEEQKVLDADVARRWMERRQGEGDRRS